MCQAGIKRKFSSHDRRTKAESELKNLLKEICKSEALNKLLQKYPGAEQDAIGQQKRPNKQDGI